MSCFSTSENIEFKNNHLYKTTGNSHPNRKCLCFPKYDIHAKDRNTWQSRKARNSILARLTSLPRWSFWSTTPPVVLFVYHAPPVVLLVHELATSSTSLVSLGQSRSCMLPRCHKILRCRRSRRGLAGWLRCLPVRIAVCLCRTVRTWIYRIRRKLEVKI